jgi:FtsZ-interacting cell division protein ZipA
MTSILSSVAPTECCIAIAWYLQAYIAAENNPRNPYFVCCVLYETSHTTGTNLALIALVILVIIVIAIVVIVIVVIKRRRRNNRHRGRETGAPASDVNSNQTSGMISNAYQQSELCDGERPPTKSNKDSLTDSTDAGDNESAYNSDTNSDIQTTPSTVGELGDYRVQLRTQQLVSIARVESMFPVSETTFTLYTTTEERNDTVGEDESDVTPGSETADKSSAESSQIYATDA